MVRHGRFKYGSAGYMKERSHLRPGPASIEESFDFPSYVLDSLSRGPDGPNRLQRLLDLLSIFGLIVGSSYSGIRCFELMLFYFINALNQKGHKVLPLRFYKALEKCPKLRDVGLDADAGSRHIIHSATSLTLRPKSLSLNR